MRTVYVQTWSKEAPTGDEPAWVNPFHSQVFGVYTLGDLVPEPTAFVLARCQCKAHGMHLVCCQDEREVLSQFWEFYKAHPPETIATYNGRKHAVPCLYWRSSVNGVPPANADLLHSRYKPGPHVDLADVLTYHGLVRIPSLAVAAGNLGLAMPKLVEGDTLQQMILAHLHAPNEAMLQMLAMSGVDYARIIARLADHWRQYLQATAY